jgi:hypothetical protein
MLDDNVPQKVEYAASLDTLDVECSQGGVVNSVLTIREALENADGRAAPSDDPS